MIPSEMLMPPLDTFLGSIVTYIGSFRCFPNLAAWRLINARMEGVNWFLHSVIKRSGEEPAGIHAKLWFTQQMRELSPFDSSNKFNGIKAKTIWNRCKAVVKS